MGAGLTRPHLFRRRADQLARDRCDDSATTHAAQCGDGPILGDDEIVVSLRASGPPSASADRDIVQFIRQRLAAGSTDLYTEALAHLESCLLREVLAHTTGNQVQAAKILGIARNSLRKKLAAEGNAAG